MKCLKCLYKLNEAQSVYGLHPSCFTEWFKVSAGTKFTNLARKSKESAEFSPSGSQESSFFLGKFRKYAANLGHRSFILKMRHADAPELPQVEYLCNQIATALKIPIADFFLIEFENELVFVTENFIHSSQIVSDLQHIYRYREQQDHSCSGLISTVKKNTRSPNDVNILISTILYDSLIGNHDRHGRNLGFIVNARGISLAPIYDNVSYLSLESGAMLQADFSPYGRIATSNTTEPGIQDYVQELYKLGHQENVKSFFNKINLVEIEDIISNSFCSAQMQGALRKLIYKRYEELKSAF